MTNKRLAIVLAGVLCFFAAAYALAQVPAVKNPTGLTFTSPDHASLTGYEVDIVKADGTVDRTLAVGKGTQDAAGIVSVVVNVQPEPFGTYTFRVRAIAGAIKSDDSAPSDPFVRSPGAPSKPTIR